MATNCIFNFGQISKELLILRLLRCQYVQSRCILMFRRPRSKRHDEAKSYRDRISEIKAEAEKNIVRNNIGFPLTSFSSPSEKEWLKDRRKHETAARHKTLELDIDEVREKWKEESGPHQTVTVATHYGIYRDLFDNCYFYPKLFMEIEYDVGEEFVMPICLGNNVTPSETQNSPSVRFTSTPDKLWTLVMTSADGNLEDSDSECLHWMIGNIPGNDIDEGEVICNYLPPFPPRGTGFLRYIFILYEQNDKLDFTVLKQPENCTSLSKRSFQTLDFYRNHEESLTPAALSFFQSEWDPSVQQFYRDTLGIKEPVFEFLQPPSYHPKQIKYPKKEPFNLYLDRYRDVKDIQEEVLKEKLKKVSPLSPPSPQLRYPLTALNPFKPSWQRLRDKHIALKRHQWKDM